MRFNTRNPQELEPVYPDGFVKLLNQPAAYGDHGLVLDAWTPDCDHVPEWADESRPELDVRVRTNDGVKLLQLRDLAPLKGAMNRVDLGEHGHYIFGDEEHQFIFGVGRHAGSWWVTGIVDTPDHCGIVFSDMGPYGTEAQAYMCGLYSGHEWCLDNEVAGGTGVRGRQRPRLSAEQTRWLNGTIRELRRQFRTGERTPAQPLIVQPGAGS